MSRLGYILPLMILLPVISYADEPTIEQVAGCVAIAIKKEGRTTQVTTTCPNDQVTIQYPDGKVKIILSSGQIIEVAP